MKLTKEPVSRQVTQPAKRPSSLQVSAPVVLDLAVAETSRAKQEGPAVGNNGATTRRPLEPRNEEAS